MTLSKLFVSDGMLTLGDFRDRISEYNETSYVRIDDLTGDRPGIFCSYRGYYEMIALTPDGDSLVTVADLLLMINQAIGATFEGYKGGEYLMRQSTPVWISKHNENSGRGLHDITTEPGGVVILKTKIFDD